MASRYEQIIANVQSMVNQNAPARDIDGYLAVEGISPAQFKKLVEGPTIGGQAKEFFKGLVPGAVGLGEAAVTGASALLPEEMEKGVRGYVGKKAEDVRKAFAPELGYEDTASRKLGEAVGSTLPFFALGPLGTAGVVAGTGVGVAAGAGEARQRAEEEGVTGSDRALATALGIGPGLLDMVAPELKVAKGIIGRALVKGGVEGATEAAQQVSQNLIAKGVYKPDQPILAGAGEEGAYGAGAGALSSFLLDAALGRRVHHAPTTTPAGLPATATQGELFNDGMAGFGKAPLEPHRVAEETEGQRQASLLDITQMRDQHDVLMREVDRLKSQYEDPAATTEQKQAILEQADKLNTLRADLEKQIKKLSKKTEGAAREEENPDQMGLDFGMPEMPRQRTGEGVALGEQEETTGALSPEQVEMFRQERVNDIQRRMAAGEAVTPAETQFLRMDARDQADALAAQPTPQIFTGENQTGEPKQLELPDQNQVTPSGFFQLQPSNIAQPQIEAPAAAATEETRPVTEEDFTAMGIGRTNKKIREALIGKDLADPAQRAEVKEVLTDFANNPNRSAKMVEGVQGFLESPTFMEQGELDLKKPRKPRAKKETTDVTGSIEPNVGATEQSTPVVGERQEAAPTGTEETVGGRLDVAPTPTEQIDAGEVTEPTALDQERVDLRTATDRLMFEGNLKRAEASRLARDLADSYDEVSSQDITDAIQSVKGGKPLYRTGGKGKKGIAAARVEKFTDRIKALWKNAPPIKVIQRADELPSRLYQQMLRDKVLPPGAFDTENGIVYLIADHIVDEHDAMLTLMHEVLGHYGIRGVLGNTYGKVMDDIYNGNITIRKQAIKKMAEGLDKHTAVEEVLAEMAEKDVSNTTIQRVINAIRQAIRKIGYNFKAVTDTEIRELLANANRFVYSGTKPRADVAAPAFTGKALWRTKPETLTPEGQKAAELNKRMEGISNPRDDGAEIIGKGLAGIHHYFTRTEGPGVVTRFRRAVVDSDATANEKIQADFNNALINSIGDVRADLLVDQAQDATGLAESYMELGGIKINDYGLTQTYAKKDAPTMKSVFDKLHKLGDKLGSLSLAVQVAHNALIANRANEINAHNAEVQKEVDAALAKKNTKAAAALEKKKVTIRASAEEIAAGLEAMETYPEIKAILKEFTEYKNGLVDFLEQTGRINAETAKNWKENAGYVPWTRIEEEVNKFDDAPTSYKTGLINLSQLPKLDREGSSKEIANVFDNMIGLTNWAIKTGLKTRAASALATQLPDAKEIKTDDDLKRELKNNKDRVVFAYKDGERTAYLLGSPLDMSAFSNNVEVLGPIVGSFKYMGDLLRGAITHMPAFALSQLIQDGTYRGMLLSGVKHPFSIPPKVFKNFGRALRGELTDLQSLGITGVYDGMPDQVARRAREKYGISERNKAKKMWDKLEHFSMAADLAVRSAIYEQTIAETKSATMPEGDQRLALYRAKEYINFKRAGANPTVRTLRHMIPFMNAYIQGMDVLTRTMQGKGVSLAEKREAQMLFLATGLKLAALNMLYTLLVGDDDDYKGLEEYERDKNYIIPGTGLKIPVAPELGFLFKVIPERVIHYVASQGTERPQDTSDFFRGFRDAFVNAYSTPNAMPQAVKPGLEVMVNYSFFTGNPIVGQAMKNVDPSLQFNSGTSEIAKLFGMVGISPMKVDHIIRGYTGMVGAIALDTVDAVADPNRASKPINKLPQVSTFMYDPSGRGYKSEFYRFRESVDQVVDTVNLFKREGRVQELHDYLDEDKLKLYAMRGVTTKVEQQLSNLRKYRNIITADPQLSGDEKQEKVKEIQEQEKKLLLMVDIPKMRETAGM